MSKEDRASEKRLWIAGGAVVILVTLAWFITLWALKGSEGRGTFGDMFGSVNALFSGLAFAGIIFTILLQRMELRYQREELRETRKEFATQNKTLTIQRFENTFFNMISNHNQIVNAMAKNDHSGSRFQIMGRDVFESHYKDLARSFEVSRSLQETGRSSKPDMVYGLFYEGKKSDLGHYFRNLFRIFKIVHETEFVTVPECKTLFGVSDWKANYISINFVERYRYTSILRAQLSDFELLLLYYNCMFGKGKNKFKELVENYSLLKNIPQHDLFKFDYIKGFVAPVFAPSAFKPALRTTHSSS